MKSAAKLPPRTSAVIADNKMTAELYAIGWLAYSCNRTQRTLYVWEKESILPRPLFDIGDKRRWYTSAELIGYGLVVSNCTPVNVKAGKLIDLVILRKSLQEFRANLSAAIKEDLALVTEPLPDFHKLEEALTLKGIVRAEKRFSTKVNRILKHYEVDEEESNTGAVSSKSKFKKLRLKARPR